MKYRDDIVRLSKKVEKIACQNGKLAEIISSILLSARNEKDRGVFTPKELNMLIAHLKIRRTEIRENNALIEDALEEMQHDAVNALREGLPAGL